MSQPERAPRTHEEMSAAMQRRLLKATVAALYDRGYGATTTMEVQHRAGVSRGALLHHYGSRTELILAAVQHLARERIDAVLVAAQSAPPEENRLEWAISVLWSTFEGPLFTAALELWLAARCDSELRAALLPQERVVGQAARAMATDLFGPDVSGAPDFPERLEVLWDAMRGAAARAVLRGADRDDRRLLARWAILMRPTAQPELGKITSLP